MTTTVIPVSSWQTIVIATLFQFTKPASDRVIMQLNAAKLRESHASYDMAGNKFKVQCLKVDADKAYRVLNNILRDVIAEEEDKALDDSEYEPHVTRLFESHLGDSLNENELPTRSATTSSDESENQSDNNGGEDSDPQLICKTFLPKDPNFLEHIISKGIKYQIESEHSCEIDRDDGDDGVAVRAFEEEIVVAVVSKLQAIDLGRIRTPIVRHISMAAGKDMLRLVKLATLKEPTLGRILLTPSSPHAQSLLNTYVILIHVYSNEAQKHKGFERVASEHSQAIDVDLFEGIHFATNYQLGANHHMSDLPVDSPQEAVASHVGEWIDGLREAAEETEAQKNSTSGKILALFGESDIMKNKIPPPALPSKSVEAKLQAFTKSSPVSKKPFQPAPTPTSAVPSLGNMRITKFSETPAPSEAWERFDTKKQPEPVAHGRWGEEAIVAGHVPNAMTSQSLNVFAKGFIPKKAYLEHSQFFSQSKTDLIDLSDSAEQDEPAGVPLIPPPGLSEVLQPEIATQNIRALEQTIVEKVEKEEDEITPHTLRRTMRQKAAAKSHPGRKGKKPGVRTVTAHAFLKEEASDIISGLSSSSAVTSPSEGPSRVNSPAKSTLLEPETLGMNENKPKNLAQSSIAFVSALHEGLRATKGYDGSISLKVQLGVVLMLEKNVPQALQTKLPLPGSTLVPKLSSSRGFATAEDSFTTAVTASPKDLSGLLLMLSIDAAKPAVQPFATYEMICQRANGEYARIHIDASAPARKSWIMPSEPALISSVYMHFPQAIHDARALVLGESRRTVDESPELQAFVEKLKITMSDHDATLPSIFGEDYGNLRVKAVYIRSTATYAIPGKNCVMRVDRVHDLECSRPQTDDEAVGNFNAGPSDRATMVDDWRVWYEVSVQLTNPPIELDSDRGLEQSPTSMWDESGNLSDTFVSSLIALKNASSDIVHRMKVVGLKNRGPAFHHWQKIDENRKKRGEVESYW